ncbi:hypothetical protein L2E82_33395 [Cichorium intybus]|uniref:Uncharacterized protein n=1 Tax=Cichorium intybus TaxID=13427 RepID=A0ACB9BK03_CICIN|nr:hypothetical protein L2E82_33395 [Cichorium intybus]
MAARCDDDGNSRQQNVDAWWYVLMLERGRKEGSRVSSNWVRVSLVMGKKMKECSGSGLRLGFVYREILGKWSSSRSAGGVLG